MGERVAGSVVGSRHPLSLLVDQWPRLSERQRQAILLIADIEAAPVSTEVPESPTRLSCTAGERSNARQGVQCEFDCGAEESVSDSTDTARSPEASGSDAAEGESGEVQS